MEEDKLLRFHERLKDFLQKNLTKLLNLVLFFVIIIALSGGWFFYQKNKEKRAFEKFVEIIHKQGDLKTLEDFVKKYGGTQAGLQASLILWDTLQKGGTPHQLNEGLNTLKKVYPRKLEGLILYAQAKVFEDSGKKAEAISIYQKLLDKDPNLKDQVLMDLARLSASTQKDVAIKYYQEIQKNYPQFYGKGLAEYKLYELKRK
jgi:predicted negative regulator of RcsB-dependent stress response